MSEAASAPATESVWDYPRPPRLEPTFARLRIVHAGITLADTTRAYRVLETSHPPVFYIPPADLRMDLLTPSPRGRSFCEFKGLAEYWNLVLPTGVTIPAIAWSYPTPTAAFAPIANALAFYASKLDECWVDDQRVTPQPGDFYGGWITANLRGPFKGAPGTLGW